MMLNDGPESLGGESIEATAPLKFDRPGDADVNDKTQESISASVRPAGFEDTELHRTPEGTELDLSSGFKTGPSFDVLVKYKMSPSPEGAAPSELLVEDDVLSKVDYSETLEDGWEEGLSEEVVKQIKTAARRLIVCRWISDSFDMLKGSNILSKESIAIYEDFTLEEFTGEMGGIQDLAGDKEILK